MEFNPFVENVNPSKDISKELSSVSLEEQYAKLTEKEKLLIWCKLHGFNRIPPSIEQMYSDEYYLGGERFFDHGTNLFQYWKDNLPKIFPNAVTNAKPFLVFGGAIKISVA